MTARKPRENRRLTEQPRVFQSFSEWKEHYFPELVKHDALEELRKDSERLATVLANDTLNRVMKRIHGN